MKKIKKVNNILIIVIIIFVLIFVLNPMLLYGFFLFVISGFSYYYQEMDSCIDLGGLWNSSTDKCDIIIPFKITPYFYFERIFVIAFITIILLFLVLRIIQYFKTKREEKI